MLSFYFIYIVVYVASCFRMNMSFVLILIWMLTLAPDSIPPVSCNHSNKMVTTIDETGNSTLQCCAYGKCYCSNLSLALEHIQSNTEIRITSDILLHGVPQFECTNDADVTIIGYNNPVVKCNHQGGLVGRNVGHNIIVIRGVMWDGCDQGIEIDGFVSVHIIQCDFRNIVPTNSALTLRGHGLVYINSSMFYNMGVYIEADSNTSMISSYTVYNSTFDNSTLAVVSIVTDDYDRKLNTKVNVSYVIIDDCSFSGNKYYSLHCKGMDYLLPTISIFSSNFVNNQMSAVKAEYCDIAIQKNCSFFNNSKSAIDISYGTINMSGPVLFYNNSKDSTGASYGGAISLLSSNMSVNKGPIKFYGNVADYGGAIYVCKISSFNVNVADLEFYSNRGRFYGGALYIESSWCDNKTYFYNLFCNADDYYTDSNTAALGGSFVYFYVYDGLHCDAPNYNNVSCKNNKVFATQPCNIVSLHEAEVFGSLTHKRDTYRFWLHDLHFNLTITDCFNNSYAPAQVFICCKNYYSSCDDAYDKYEYMVDSFHNNITLINDTVVSCPVYESSKLQLTVTAYGYNMKSASAHGQIDAQILSSKYTAGNCTNDIAHVSIYDYFTGIWKCDLLSCNLQIAGSLYVPKGIVCSSSSFSTYFFQNFTVIPGYWFSNGFTHYVENCPRGYCNSIFNLYTSIAFAKGSYPTSNDQCASNWTGLACGECGKDNYIIHDSTNCVHSSECYLESYNGLILFFFLSLLYWIMVISLIFVLLHFKFDITAGYAYGIIFYYSILEQTVDASYIGTQNNYNENFIATILSILSTIGNMKPPYQLLKLCFGEFMMIDHMFLTYFHPFIVTCLIFAIFISARNFVIVARTIGRYVNSKSICILLILSYSSVSYTSVQLLRPLAIQDNAFSYYDYDYRDNIQWHSYLSPEVKFFHGHHLIYCIIAILCEVVIGLGLPVVLVSQPYLTRYFNINFTSIKPVIDQLMGCYKEEYRWFAAYYLMCRQVIFFVDIGTDFSPNIVIKYSFLLMVYTLIMMVHVWFQPYKQRKLNILDSSILMTLILVYIGEHTSYGSTVVLWILPLVLFINCIAFTSRLKYLLIPISCSGMTALSLVIPFVVADNLPYYLQVDYTFYYINFMIALISFIILLAYLIYVLKCLCVIVINYKRHHRPAADNEYRMMNLQYADDSNEVNYTMM